MFARFDENPAMTLRVIKETKRYGRTDGWTHDGSTDGRTHGRTDNVKTVYPLQTKFAGGIYIFMLTVMFCLIYLYALNNFHKLTDCELRIVFESVSKTCCHGNCKLSAILLSSSSIHGIPERKLR